MKKEQISNLTVAKKIHSGEGSNIYKLTDDRLLKIVSSNVLQTCQIFGITYESKVSSDKANNIKGILKPSSIVYKDDICLGYTMREIKGETLNTFDNKYTLDQRSDLKRYYEIYSKLENIIIQGNNKGLVFPDLCTCDNIMLLPDGSIKIIDYDGIQFGKKDKTLAISTSLGEPTRYVKSAKYSHSPFCFTKELDITSLTILMFLVIFNINLNNVGTYNPFTGQNVTLKDVFELLNIDDEVFMNKVAANLSFKDKGTYLQDELYKIMRTYQMESYPLNPKEKVYIKKLFKN